MKSIAFLLCLVLTASQSPAASRPPEKQAAHRSDNGRDSNPRHDSRGHRQTSTAVAGTVTADDGTPVDYATVYLKGTSHACYSDEKGHFRLQAPAGKYKLVVSSVGYKKGEYEITLRRGETTDINIRLKSDHDLDEVVVTGNQLSKVNNSAFNATALDTEGLANTTKNLSDALSKAPGMKIRESGGVGSDMSVTMDGFSGKHVKVFIDGVPQEGAGSSFGLNNIPVNFAERIEVYRGVVPVGFGSDAIGGVINIVTPKRQRSWFLDASYSYGSFNTHKSYINFGQTLSCGFKYEINLFQNYSDNNYWVDSPVEDFATGAYNRRKLEHVRRFNDTYHNEAVVAKVGFVNKSWADRLLFGFTYSHMYKEVQTGVRQEIVYGQKHRHGHSLNPSLEYTKRNLFIPGLDIALSANYNRNATVNVDTVSVRYNWLGQTDKLNSPGEQSYQLSRADNNNWSGTLTSNYRLGEKHLFTINDVLNSFNRSNVNLLTTPPSEDEFTKVTSKNIFGLSYRFQPVQSVNISVFGKEYHQYVSGPIASGSAQDTYELLSRSDDYLGYGAAASWMLPYGFLLKGSYEKAYRLPTIEEMFGDEDLEVGDISLRPESSHNINLNLSYNGAFPGGHSLFAEAGFIFRDTRDYIQRNILALTGGKSAATYINYGKVMTKGLSASLRYGFQKWVSAGGSFTLMNVRDNMKTAMGASVANIAYGERMPNLPYMFADMDANFYWHDLFAKGNMLTLTYDNQFTHSFCYYTAALGSNAEDFMVPNQFAHNLTLSYSIANGRYSFSFECRNFTDTKLYDNFSLQKPGRAFFGKIRVYFGN
ncbi:MAG: carboxypeptidase-like regulatory domain-containing protein [Muribaculaceae bacterium]|nr:carboxypeptidase-like regulatory domain-containing protein [Muribaculaceae bacterium]